jgi:hypothetical protein
MTSHEVAIITGASQGSGETPGPVGLYSLFSDFLR